MKSLTICYVTARPEPRFDWFFQSLLKQNREQVEQVYIIIVDFFADDPERRMQVQRLCPDFLLPRVVHTLPKPNVWQGKHRKTVGHWWAKSAYLNTAICLAKTEWIACLDDRSVIMPGYFGAINRAMAGGYAVCGRYQKRTGVTVEDGYIKHGGIVVGEDPRYLGNNQAREVPGSFWFGCNNALPVEDALKVNGYDETCDSLGLEDCIFGGMLERQGFAIHYDPAMFMVEDRTPEFYESAVGRTDKGVSPKDKSHSLVALTKERTTATHHWNLREIRARVQSGQAFPIPEEPTVDWWDSRPLLSFP